VRTYALSHLLVIDIFFLGAYLYILQDAGGNGGGASYRMVAWLPDTTEVNDGIIRAG
jgi:hypothetical protein